MGKIRIRLNSKTGQIYMKAKGFSGPACEKPIKLLRQLVGEAEMKKTEEYFRQSLNLGGKIDTSLCG